jgi:hypothetical protein
MEFDAEVQGECYHFTSINNSSILVSGTNGEYILYKNQTWRCADELSREIIEELGEVIDEHMRFSYKR